MQAESRPEAPVRPSGTVTFLFSDIEGSTSRWDTNRQAMAAALSRHDSLLREIIEAHTGYVFKTVGDAFYAAFAKPEDAIVAALDVQRALGAQDFSAVDGLHVRLALHTGTAIERDGDYFGPALNRVARLLAIGYGEQVLVSGTSADLLQGIMPPQSSLRDLGAHRLKDLAQPEQVYQLVAPDLRQDFPPLRSLDRLPNNLPPQLTSFVGRENELAEIKALIEHHRFVTLVGTGGAGKTRCALQVGGDLLDGSGDGVWFAELAPVSQASLVPGVVAQALNVESVRDRPILDCIVEALKNKRLLLILDNCEHVIDEARNLIGVILAGCPQVRILATSREGLNIAGEHVYRVPSLSAPTQNEHVSRDAELRFGAIALFVDRAVASDGRFTFTDENAPFVAEICRRLDGIPLAIELAAARIKVLSPQQLAQKLNERFRVLTGGNRRALPRQQTMRALVDWSYDLLSEDERALFRKLGIFAGGFTLEIATTVCSDGPLDEISILDMLSSLVDKSLVQAEPSGSGTRYRLLESMRQYARERLDERGEYAAIACAHAKAFLAFAEDVDNAFETVPQPVWNAQTKVELENLRAALEWTVTMRNDVAVGREIAGHMRNMWAQWAPLEGRRWLDSIADLADSKEEAIPDIIAARLCLADARLDAVVSKRSQSHQKAERAMTIFEELGDEKGALEAQFIAGAALFRVDPAKCASVLGEALATARRLDCRKMAANILLNLGSSHQYAGDLAGARAYFSEAVAVGRSVGHSGLAAAGNLAECEYAFGDAAAALRLVDENIDNARFKGTSTTYMLMLTNSAQYLVALNRYEEARARALESLAATRDIRHDALFFTSLQHLAAVAALRDVDTADMLGNRKRAARLLGYVDARYTETDIARETEDIEYRRVLAKLREALGEDELSLLMTEGSNWSEDRAVTEAMLV